MNNDEFARNGDEIVDELVNRIVDDILELEKQNISRPKPHGLPDKICAIAERIVK